ncbi:hypothetical protein [Pseudomonas fluorescens]|nr:hypothetical protein [Pseudomonas fluorescens]
MRRFFVAFLMILLSGCVTNQLHFAAYSTEAQLAAIKSRVVEADIVQVTGGDPCTRCSESSKVVWHAANYKVGLYQGFARIPVDDWAEFTRRSVGAIPVAAMKTSVEINRVFLKTWNSPEYYACEVSLTVDIGGAKYAGWARLKLKEPGQSLIGPRYASLNAEVLGTVGLTLKAAYLDALDKSKSVP